MFSFWITFFFSGGRIYSLTPTGKINGLGSYWIGSILKIRGPLLKVATWEKERVCPWEKDLNKFKEQI